MTTTQLTILRTIAARQPAMIRDLHSAIGQGIVYCTFSNILTDMYELGLIHKGGHKGPIWLTVRGSQVAEGVTYEEI